MLDSGQYDPRWPLIHMNPEEAVQAAVDLKAKAIMPMHIGRFSLSYLGDVQVSHCNTPSLQVPVTIRASADIVRLAEALAAIPVV